jgi:hypothetical protein
LSPVTDIPPEPAPDPRVEALQRAQQRVARTVGATDRVPLRVIVLALIVGACAVTAPIPFNAIAVMATVLLIIDIATRRHA